MIYLATGSECRFIQYIFEPSKPKRIRRFSKVGKGSKRVQTNYSFIHIIHNIKCVRGAVVCMVLCPVAGQPIPKVDYWAEAHASKKRFNHDFRASKTEQNPCIIWISKFSLMLPRHELKAPAEPQAPLYMGPKASICTRP